MTFYSFIMRFMLQTFSSLPITYEVFELEVVD